MTGYVGRDPLETLGTKLTSEQELHRLLPSPLAAEISAADAAYRELFELLSKKDARWLDPAWRQQDAIAGGHRLYGSDKLSEARQRKKRAFDGMQNEFRTRLSNGELRLIGRIEPTAGELLLLNAGPTWKSARFDVKTGRVYSPLTRSFVYDARLVPVEELRASPNPEAAEARGAPSQPSRRGRPPNRGGFMKGDAAVVEEAERLYRADRSLTAMGMANSLAHKSPGKQSHAADTERLRKKIAKAMREIDTDDPVTRD